MKKLRETVRAKVPFGIFKRAMGEFFGFNSDYLGISFDGTFKKADKLLQSAEYDVHAFNTMLQELLINYLSFGKKIVYSFSVSAGNLNNLKQAILAHESYSTIKDIEGLNSLDMWSRTLLSQKGKNKRYFLSTAEDGEFFVTYWGGKRIENHRESIPPEDLGERYKKYADIYGVKEFVFQSYDTVILDFKRGTLDILIENSRHKKISDKERYNLRTHLLDSFKDEFNIDSSWFRHTEINYFPFIEHFYKNKGVSVKNHGFKTKDGLFSDSHIQSLQDDLREDAFIKGGSKVVNNKLTGYSIVFDHFNKTTRNGMRIAIPGTKRLLKTSNPKILNYEFYPITTFEDYRFIKDAMNIKK